MAIHNILIIIILLVAQGGTTFGAYLPDKAKELGIAFISAIEMRKTQRSELEKKLIDLKRQRDLAQKTITTTLGKLAIDLEQAQEQQQDAVDQKADFLNKKIAISHDRKQNLFDFQDSWKETTDLIEVHIKILGEMIEYLQAKKPEYKTAYSWKELRDLQIKLFEDEQKNENNRSKRENTKKLKLATQERLSSYEKQRDAKNKERERQLSHYDSNGKKTYIDTGILKAESEIVSLEITAIQEKIDHTKLLIEKLEIENKLWEDVIEYGHNKLLDQRKLLAQLQNRLVLDYNDVETAKDEWKKEAQEALELKESISAEREPKKEQKEKISFDIEASRQRLSEFKDKGKHDRIGYLLVKSQLKRLIASSNAIDQEIQYLDAKKDLADLKADEKELQFNMVELLYKLKIEAEDIDTLLASFQSKKELAVSNFAMLKDKHKDLDIVIVDIDRQISKHKGSQEKLRSKKTTTFKGRDNNLRIILSQIEETKVFLEQQKSFTQHHQGMISELMEHQENIIKQYDLIINELEAKHKTYGIWKRSPKAISLESVPRALLEAEAFLKNLYWETPAHLKVSTVYKTIRSLKLFDYLFLLLSILLYIVTFIGIKRGLAWAKKNSQMILTRYQGRTRYLYLQLVFSLVDFSLEHFTLLFSWCFIFIHIAFDFKYILKPLAPFASNYNIAVFHLISIPILVYLASQFIESLKSVNKQLSFYFFAETFQEKFILLVTIFCYTTAILIPFRHALLTYTDALYSEFATLILAAYSLTLVVVLLFLFSKSDVLKFIPSHTTFFIWFKRKIDKYYYPVFVFVMGLLILANPYIGYSNMSWFLAFAVPSSALLFYMLFMAHYYVRKYALFMFMQEEDEEIIDKFEHAKTYYGFFVIFSFLLLLFSTIVLVSRIWGLNYTPADMWKILSEQWVVRISVDSKLGLIELLVLSLFVAAGFVFSSIIHKFMFNRLFDILRTEPGTQNTISRIVHYIIIFVAVMLGLNAINLQQFIFWVGASLGVTLVFSLQDIVKDLLAGFFVLIERPIEIGNYIQIDDTQGTVHRISARSTTIITSKNHSIIIPNKDLISKWITNWGHGRFAVGFELNIRVEHGTDPELVKKVLATTIQANPLILKVPGIVSRLEDIDDNALVFLTRAFISARRVKEQWEIAAALRTEIIKALKAHNIVLAKPARVVYLADNTGKTPKAVDITFDR
jgi:small-conductance mechanosensitive channel